jgi:polar amino acid transport system ATP-binding protein
MIEVEGLVKRFNGVEILRGVGLAVAKGEVAAIIGPSGSGKSTLLRCLNGLETFQAGSVVVDGLRIDASCAAKVREATLRQVCRRAGMVFQAYNLFPHRTVLENVTEAPIHVLGMARAEAEAQARTLLERVGLGDKLAARPRSLSGGQQQRVAIARALAMGPRIMLFDEPTSALDPRMTAEVLAVMTDLARDGLTMVVVTHAMRFARRLARTIHVISDGRIVETGPPDQVFDAPRSEATRQLLADADAA